MRARDLPNIISVIRIFLVLPVVLQILDGEYFIALILFVIAGVSDGIDGYLAKHYGWQSRLGSILDPIADKLLLVSTFLAMAWVGLIPLWLVIAAFTRDIIIVIGGYAYHVLLGEFQMAPSLISKFNTFMQIVLVSAALSLQITSIPDWVMGWLVIITLVSIVLSGLDYVIVWGRKAYYSTKKTKNIH